MFPIAKIEEVPETMIEIGDIIKIDSSLEGKHYMFIRLPEYKNGFVSLRNGCMWSWRTTDKDKLTLDEAQKLIGSVKILQTYKRGEVDLMLQRK